MFLCSLKKHKKTFLTSMGKSLMTCLAVSIEYRRVTDRQTDRQTDRHLATA